LQLNAQPTSSTTTPPKLLSEPKIYACKPPSNPACSFPQSLYLTFCEKSSAIKHTRVPITLLHTPVPTHPTAGAGRLVRFADPQPLSSLIARIARGVGNPVGFPIAIPQGSSVDEISVSSVGICAGSGASVLSPLGREVDLLFTGEMSHHDALAAVERGQCVVTLFHSNSERGFLQAVLKGQLEKAVREEWDEVREEERKGKDLEEEVLEALEDDEVNVEVSERDRDPYGIVIAS
jgi:putative NIF3 family GTP cyclohydrolase 1 type 2